MATESTCATCGDAVPDDATAVQFAGDTYCTDCTTRAKCGDCGAVGTLPESVLDGDDAVQCGNCGGVLRADDP